MATSKSILFPVILFLSPVYLFSQQRPQIAEEAIEGAPVQFINRTNRRATEAARAQEINLGRNLGEQIIQADAVTSTQIQVQRIFDPDVEKYGADIMSILPQADFGHIRSIMRVVQGYLETSFEYTPRQAATLSELIIFYNAALRLRPELIQNSYSINVLKELNLQKAGIDRNYRNWSGNTQLLIPLRKNIVRPDSSDLDREEIRTVLEQDKSINLPKEKREEIQKIESQRKAEDLQRLEKKEQEIQRKEQEIQRKEQELETQRQNIQKQMEDTNRVLQELRKDPVKNEEQIKKEEAKQQQLQEQQQSLQAQQEQIQNEKAQIEKEKQEIAEQKQEIQNNQTTVARKEEEKKETQQALQEQTKVDERLQNLQKEVENLRKELQKKEELSENVINEKIIFLKVIRFIEGGHYNNELWMIDPNNDDALFKGPFTNICSRKFLAVENLGVLVVGYEGSINDHSTHFLYLLDENTLQVKKRTKEKIAFNTFIEFRDNSIYVIEELDGKHYLAKFNRELELESRSEVPVHPHTEITFFKNKIYLTGSGRETSIPIQVFDKQQLKLLKTISPQLLTNR